MASIDLASVNNSTANSTQHTAATYQNAITTGVAEGDVATAATLTFVAVVIIVATVVGNLLVVAAVCTEPRLRKVSNSYIVSLAAADLAVGLIVCPIMLAYHLLGGWTLGVVMCDVLVSVDVICCTASIMNLCVISIDRYYAITQPLRYVYKRTPRRAATMIASVWLFSFVIALPPLVGWREPRPGPMTECMISQDKGYTVFSTVGAFYLPLIVMLAVYWQVYRAALRRQMHWVPGPGSSRACVGALCTSTRSLYNSILTAGDEKEEEEHGRNSPGKRMSEPWLSWRSSLSSSSLSLRHSDVALSAASIGRLKRIRELSLGLMSSRKSPPKGSNTLNAIVESNAVVAASSDEQHSPAEILNNNSRQNELLEMHSIGGDHVVINSRRVGGDGQHLVAPVLAHRVHRKRHSDVNRISMCQERRAAKTLGIIMGCFVVCWLPFFLIALLMPLCESCDVPPLVITGFTWLGYFNSALNPIIYTCFNEDFRKAFARILHSKICLISHLKNCVLQVQPSHYV
ncbi:PREDICTED: 5-hydroxytryptamine receptor 1D-like [Priapulus caudatus]|uniref:5-hydroxytryptamine receptor 1D-like n=1 Tax=Priapulus caudatus TaxID=37621 RepID=A0ABM1F535_PRICU|nr:PREDICTED: 5-hydroxytryptamine receptor 1D-like [Priapulus caudatus]